jgi:hypothetical protein
VRMLHRLKPVPLLFATTCYAENICPWLNAATAAGILGGPVTASVSPAVCEFIRPQSTLHIEVRKKPATIEAKCESKGTPLKGIGNEAVICLESTFITGGLTTKMVIGRVRDQRFAVWIRTSDPDLAPTVSDRTRKIAEQVAGNLF